MVRRSFRGAILSAVVKNYVVKEDVYNAKSKSIEDKIPDITNLATNTTLNATINEVKGKIPNITSLATITALTAVENEILDHNIYITTPEFNNKLTAENFAERLAQANLASKNDIANFVEKTDFDDKLKNLNKKVTSNKTKHVLAKNEFKKIQTFDPSYLNNDGARLYLIFQPLYYSLKRLGDTEKVVSWKSKGFSTKKHNDLNTADNSPSPPITWYESSNFCLTFKGSCLKQKTTLSLLQI